MAGISNGVLSKQVKNEALEYLNGHYWYRRLSKKHKLIANERFLKRVTVHGYNRLQAMLMAEEYMEGYTDTLKTVPLGRTNNDLKS